MPAASAVIAAPVLIFSDFQCSRFVAVVLRHGVFPKNDRRRCLELLHLRPTRLFCQKLLTQSQKNGNAKADPTRKNHAKAEATAHCGLGPLGFNRPHLLPGLTGAPNSFADLASDPDKMCQGRVAVVPHASGAVAVSWCRPSKRYKTDSGGN